MTTTNSSTVEELTNYFTSIGFTETRATETSRNLKTSETFKTLANLSNGLITSNAIKNDKQATLLLQISKDSSKLKDLDKIELVKSVLNERLKSSEQVSSAIKYLAVNPSPVDEAAFDRACGVGFTSTPEEIVSKVTLYLEKNLEDIKKQGWKGMGKVIGGTKLDPWLKWASSVEVAQVLEQKFTEYFGGKEESLAKAAKEAKEAKEAAAAAKVAKSASTSAAITAVVEEPVLDMFSQGWLSRLHKPGENPQIDPKLKAEHLKATGGKVFTRFPPEPNGFLHIGHSKAIAVNFGFAKHHQGHCYLRFDDTNPEAEEQIYFDKILEAVRWLGYEPYRITYSSDHFQELYDLAVDLIKRGLAYTSDDTAADIALQRGGKDHHSPRTDSKDRTKPIAQSLAEFEQMKAGKYEPGQMTLRMKQDMQSGNPVMWDIIAYRVLKAPHHRTGDSWCIYPTYDFTHCLCDSFENISHSLCTTEFVTARTSYEWLCDALEMYKPRQSEYGRLNLEGTVMSKRKLLRLVKESYVSGWDDPRLYTLVALKRRGVPPGAINNFVTNLGVSTSPCQVPLSRFEQEVRQYLEKTTPRLMMVLNPIKITIENLDSSFTYTSSRPIHPKNPALGELPVLFTPTIYIDRDDFRLESSKEFFRLSPGSTVGLLNVPYPITHVSHTIDPVSGQVTEIKCRYANSPGDPGAKVWVQWVAEHQESKSPVRIQETRIFTRLFKSDDPASLGDAYIQDIDPNSLTVVSGALIETGIWKVVADSQILAKKLVDERKIEAEKLGVEAPPSVDGLEVIRFQGMRVAYFALDQESKIGEDNDGKRIEDGLVLNLVAALKQDSGKKA